MSLPDLFRCRGCSTSVSGGASFIVRNFALDLGSSTRWVPCSCGSFTSVESETLGYEESYGDDYPAYNASSSAFRRLATRRTVAARIRKLDFPRSGSVLDFGCGSGRTLETLKAILGSSFTYFGCDIKDARQPAIRDFTQFVEPNDLDRFEEKFDVVNSSQSIEHVEDPVSTIALLVRLLKPGGVLLLDTPNAANAKRFGERWGGWHSPHHCCVLSKHALEEYCLKPLQNNISWHQISEAPAPFIFLDTVVRSLALRLSLRPKAVTVGRLFNSDVFLTAAVLAELILMKAGRTGGNLVLVARKRADTYLAV